MAGAIKRNPDMANIELSICSDESGFDRHWPKLKSF